MKRIIIINGPNLNLVGRRQPEIYGSRTFEDYFDGLHTIYNDKAILSYYQSNHEGDLIDKLHQIGFSYDGIILNAGAYSHTSIAIADAISSIDAPAVEVHISDINRREEFRKHSYLTPVCVYHVIGKGLEGYKLALDYLVG